MDVALTGREAEFMQILWEHGPATVGEVRARLHDDPAYTTVLSILRTLEDKGYVKHTSEGRAHRYAACVDRDIARTSALRELSKRFFSGSIDLLLTHLVEDQDLSELELKRIRQLLNQRRK